MFPLRSTIRPRGACLTISRTRLVFASAVYLSPESTWRYQSRKKTIANITSATPPTIATRSASWGDIGARFSESRYITEASPPDLESAQAERAGLARLAAAAHPLERVHRQHRPQHAPHEGEERQRDRHVQEDRDDRLAQHEQAHVRADVEEEADAGDRDEVAGGGDGGDRERQQAVRGVAQVAVAADAVAERRQHQRAQAHRLADHDVEQDAGREAGDRAGDRAGVDRDRGHAERDQV